MEQVQAERDGEQRPRLPVALSTLNPVGSTAMVFSTVAHRFWQPQPDVTDGELLERFCRCRDEAAFKMLVERHGPAILGVCRRVLRHTQDAEDAFQTTFLALARKASTIGRGDSVGGWLYTVAYRISLRVRARTARRGGAEVPLDELTLAGVGGDPADVLALRDLRPLLDAEIKRLPEKYRTAFVLCHLEDRTCDEAAQILGCPRGTVASRLARGRERLRRRLAGRGCLAGASGPA
jgi:HlyD family secretion protein